MADFESDGLAEQEMAWLAIRQPAIVRMLERDLASSDSDALAAGLELTSQVLSERSDQLLSDQSGPSGTMMARFSTSDLAAARAQIASAMLDPGIARWTSTRLAGLPAVFSAHDEEAIGRAIAAIIRVSNYQVA